MKRCFGLIGYPLTHSFSAQYFNEKFFKENIENVSYELFVLENISGFEKLKSSIQNLNGLNVTIPYKESIIPYLTEIDSDAKNIEAVNTIKFEGSDAIGFNTDFQGFINAIEPNLESHHKKALVLGSGGSSKAICYGLKKLGIEFKVVSRSLQKGVSFLYPDVNKDIIEEHNLIINTTPLGMLPNESTSPNIPYEFISSKHLVFDLVYNPKLTLFMYKAQKNGAVAVNGMSMLIQQAELSWAIWNEN